MLELEELELELTKLLLDEDEELGMDEDEEDDEELLGLDDEEDEELLGLDEEELLGIDEEDEERLGLDDEELLLTLLDDELLDELLEHGGLHGTHGGAQQVCVGGYGG